jgi:hypothetical protein
MALIIKDRVKETTTTEGTGTVTLAGASTGFQSFAAIGNANTTYYTIAGQGTNEWEVGLGTYTASGTTLSRDTVLSNSLGTTAKINFSAGDKDVFCTYPSGKSINQDASGNVGIGVTPSAWNTAYPALQIGNTGSINAESATESMAISSNVYRSGLSTLRIKTGWATQYIQFSGYHVWQTSLNGTGAAGSSVNFTSPMELTPTGNLNIEGFLTSFSMNPNQAVFTDANNTLVSKAVTGTGSVVLNDSPTFTTAITSTGALQLTGSATVNQNIASSQTSGNLQIGGTAQTTGTITIGGTSATGAITLGQSTAAQTVNIATGVTAASTTKAVNIGTAGNATSTTNIAIGSATGTSTTTVNGYFKPPALASAPTYVKGAVYFDTTLNKLRVGGATTWETITSI